MRDDVIPGHPIVSEFTALALFVMVMLVPIIWGDSDEHIPEPLLLVDAIAD